MEENTNNITASEKECNTVPVLTHVEANQEGYRWVAITAMLFAIGIILHTGRPDIDSIVQVSIPAGEHCK